MTNNNADILHILMSRITEKNITINQKKNIAQRLHEFDVQQAIITIKIINSYFMKYDKDKPVIGQEESDIPYSGKQLTEGVEFHIKMIPDNLFLILNEYIKHIDSQIDKQTEA